MRNKTACFGWYGRAVSIWFDRPKSKLCQLASGQNPSALHYSCNAETGFNNSSSSEISHILDCLPIQNGTSSKWFARAAGFSPTFGGCSFSRGKRCSLDSQKEFAVRATPKKQKRLGIEPTTYLYIFKPTVTSHGGTGSLNRGIVHIGRI
jgi:hypothetical protein